MKSNVINDIFFLVKSNEKENLLLYNDIGLSMLYTSSTLDTNIKYFMFTSTRHKNNPKDIKLE